MLEITNLFNSCQVPEMEVSALQAVCRAYVTKLPTHETAVKRHRTLSIFFFGEGLPEKVGEDKISFEVPRVRAPAGLAEGLDGMLCGFWWCHCSSC